jgi:hypothetical protein
MTQKTISLEKYKLERHAVDMKTALAFAAQKRYSASVPEKKGNEFGDSISTRRTNRAMRFFYVCHAFAYPLWGAVAGIPSGMPVTLYAGSPTPPFAAHPFGDGRSVTTVQGVNHA